MLAPMHSLHLPPTAWLNGLFHSKFKYWQSVFQCSHCTLYIPLPYLFIPLFLQFSSYVYIVNTVNRVNINTVNITHTCTLALNLHTCTLALTRALTNQHLTQVPCSTHTKYSLRCPACCWMSLNVVECCLRILYVMLFGLWISPRG